MTSPRALAAPSYSSLRRVGAARSVSRVFLHDGGIPGGANRGAREDALFLDSGSERPLTVIASFPMGPRDSARRMTYVATDRSGLGHGTEPCDSSSRPSDLFRDTFYRGAAGPVSPPRGREWSLLVRESTLSGETRGVIDPPRFR